MGTNVDVARAMVDAVIRQDVDAFVAFCTPDVVWEENTNVFPGLPAVSHGQAEVRNWFREAIVETWAKVEMASEFEEVGDACLLAEHQVTAVGRMSGVQTRLHFWEVAWFRDRKIRWRQLFMNEDDARTAATTSPVAPA